MSAIDVVGSFNVFGIPPWGRRGVGGYSNRLVLVGPVLRVPGLQGSRMIEIIGNCEDERVERLMRLP
jgi:hypothetical protein